jgi:hypothetical protein
MAIEAPYSKYSKTNFKIAIAVCIGLAIVFAYDGYLSKYEWSLRRNFYEKHVKDGKADSDMVFNRKSPFVLVPLAAVLIGWFWLRKNQKLVADEDGLAINANEKIAYDSIQKIDKTYFASKHYFTVTYKDKDGNEVGRKLSSRKYDNLAPILEHLVAKIS